MRAIYLEYINWRVPANSKQQYNNNYLDFDVKTFR